MEFINLSNEEKFLILEQKRLKRNENVRNSYRRRVEEGRNTRIIPKDEQKKRGRKCIIKTLEDLEKTSLKLSSKRGPRKRDVLPLPHEVVPLELVIL